MSTGVAYTRWWQTFEVVFGIPFLAAIALQLAVPLSLPRGLLLLASLPVGVALIILGTILVVLARRELAQQSQPTESWAPDEQGGHDRCFLCFKKSALPGRHIHFGGNRASGQSSLGARAAPPSTSRMPLRADSTRRAVPRTYVWRGISNLCRRNPSLDWSRSTPKLTVQAIPMHSTLQIVAQTPGTRAG